ncbi:MAG: bifunctional UDP-N-acetylglucosamine diphosphorylase/glucosamine-1-phosphate N-acetyltransferase GlmU [Anaerolineae bacterium]|nr:bifunctional UDP-N-acetylglucosamine diphosphorylase/glucosamine-1-phosphate N-acetyltransferase GlmU [Anaerolineae bacterium]
MKSSKAKVLHEVGGKPMVVRSIETAEKLTALYSSSERPVVVVGRDADAVKSIVGERATFVTQAELLGTAHAVAQAESVLRGKATHVVVYYADMPLLEVETLRSLVESQVNSTGVLTLLTVIQDDPRGFGRIVRNEFGQVVDIVEEREATSEQLKIKELNAGVYCFQADWLWDHLSRLKTRSNGEYYLTDLPALSAIENQPGLPIVHNDIEELIGINTRVHLADAEAALRRRINRKLMLSGVTIIDPATTYIHESVSIGQDTVILPNTHIYGATQIGSNCEIGPDTTIIDSRVGNSCEIRNSVIEEAIIEDRVNAGPYCHLRKGSHLEAGVHMGNFGEVKNSRLGAGTRMGHFSYIGDSDIGVDVNIGAGTITANFDGVRKNKTIVGDHAFIGSDSILVAPVTISNNARTAAGSVVTRNVPEGHIAIGVPARMRQIRPPASASVDQQQPLQAERKET